MKDFLIAKDNAITNSNRLSGAFLALRAIVGIAFIAHGMGKVASPGGAFGWMGPDAPVPAFFQGLSTLAEFGGGLAILLGLLFPLVSLILIINMGVALTTHFANGDPFLGGYELALVFFVTFIFFFITGPGRYAVDYYLQRQVGSSAQPFAKSPA